jgi:Signal transduction histidine kinase
MKFSSFPSKDRVTTWAVPVLLACVLVATAVLQYRWSREVSEAASTRMQASLQNSMMNFRLDLARELATTCLELQGENASTADARNLTERLKEWQRRSLLSGLILNVYEWKRASAADAPLQRLSTQAQPRFDNVDWPANFDAAHQLLLSASSIAMASRDVVSPVLPSREHSTNKASPSSTEAPSPIIGAVDESVPILIVPATRTDDSVWLLVELDRNVLRDRLFPQLSERYFGDSRSSEYEVAVIAARSGRPEVLFSSGSRFGADPRVTIDSSLNLFGPPIVKSGTPQAVSQPNPAQSLTGLSQRAQTALPSVSPDMGYFKIRFDPVHSAEPMNDERWQIVVKHRYGSVAAAVARLRYRDLKLSFGVLLVLAASVALIVFNSQRARRLALLQMDFVVGVSHELRTPVAAILSISENIVDGVVEDEKQLLRYGGMIRNQAKRLQHLVEQVLRFAAVHRRTTSYTIRQLQIPDVIDDVLESMSTFIAASGFTVERKLDAGIPPVNADFGVLSQCLQNLISNSIKYGGENKWIGIRATVNNRGTIPEISVRVEDRGIGIDPGELKHIFEPFYRSPKVMESPVPGTGLGLSLARSFAEAMGGWLTVESEPGKGSAFTIHLPAASGSGTESKPIAETDVVENLRASELGPRES